MQNHAPLLLRMPDRVNLFSNDLGSNFLNNIVTEDLSTDYSKTKYLLL